MVQQMLLVALGGATGSVFRFLIQNAWNLKLVPFGTSFVNLVGSFLIGFLFVRLESLPDHIKPLVIAGFLGGFTTMSSFSLEVVTMLKDGKWQAAAMHWAIGAIFCLVGAYLGLRLGKVPQ